MDSADLLVTMKQTTKMVPAIFLHNDHDQIKCIIGVHIIGPGPGPCVDMTISSRPALAVIGLGLGLGR
jgi:hypothetical protein